MARQKADSMAGLYRLSAASFDYAPLSLPEKVPTFSILNFSLLRFQTHARQLTETVSHVDHRLMALRRRQVAEPLKKTSQSLQQMVDMSRKVEERCKGLN